MKASSQIAWNAVTKWGATGIQSIVELVLVPFLILKLTKSGYGVAGIAMTIISLTFMADLGLKNALIRQLSASVAQKDWRSLNCYLNSALAAYLGVGLIAAGVCVSLAPVLARVFKVGPDLMPQAVFLIRYYCSAAFLVAIVRICFGAVLNAHHRYDITNHIYAGLGIARGAALYAILAFTTSGLYGWAAGTFAALALEAALTILLAVKISPGIRLGASYVQSEKLRSLLSLGGYFFIISLVGMLGELSDPFVLTSFLGPIAVAIYKPARSLALMIRTIVMGMAWQINPLTTNYYVTGQMDQLRLLLTRATRFTLLIGVPACVFLAVFAQPIAAVWLKKRLGDDYMTTAWLLVAFACVELIAYAGGAQGAVMLGMKKLRFPVAINLPLGILNLLGSIWLVGYTHLGAIGVVIPTIICQAVARICETIYTARIAELGVLHYLKDCYVRPILAMIILLPPAMGIRMLVHPQTLVRLALATAMFGLVAAAICWLVGLNNGDRAGMGRLVSGMFRKILPVAEVAPPA